MNLVESEGQWVTAVTTILYVPNRVLADDKSDMEWRGNSAIGLPIELLYILFSGAPTPSRV